MNVDATYVISLKEDKQRRELFEKNFPKMKFNWFIVERDPDGGMAGCYRSHRRVMEMAKEKGYQRILIMEDDAFPLKPWNKIVKITNKALNQLQGKEWNFLLLGLYPYRTKKIDKPNVLKLISGSCTQSYIVNLKTTTLPPPFEQVNEHIDLYLFQEKTNGGKYKNFTTYPMLIFQDSMGDSSVSPDSTLQRYSAMVDMGCDRVLEMSSLFDIWVFIAFLVVLFILIIFGCCLGGRRYYYDERNERLDIFFVFIIIVFIIVFAVLFSIY